MRVGIVDDDEWVREGRAAALRRSPDVDVIVLGSHADARGRTSWSDVDVVLLDARDSSDGDGEFAVVGVVRAVRAHRTRSETRIVVITAHAYDDRLRVQMAEAGADVLYPHAEVGVSAALEAVVRGCAPTRSR